MRRAARDIFHFVVGAIVLTLYALVVVPFGRLSRSGKRDKPRVLWAPIPIIGIRYAALADRSQGLASTTLVYDVYSINARSEFDIVLDRYARVPVLGRLVPYVAFLWAGLRYDVFCFYFDGGLLYATPWWRVELVLLRLAGRRIVVIPYGGDARLASATRTIKPWNLYSDVEPGEEDRDECEVLEHRKAFGRSAHAMLGCADIAEDLPRVDGMFRFPYDRGSVESPSRSESGARDSVVIVHAPNHRHYKGTRFLIDAVEVLRGEGYPVELDLVEKVENRRALERYAEADIAADQFLAGAYALFAIELMSLGKPVLAYLNERFRPWHPEWDECPIINASPDDLVDTLRRLVVDVDFRVAAGNAGPAYVEKYHSLESVGRDMAALYARIS